DWSSDVCSSDLPFSDKGYDQQIRPVVRTGHAHLPFPRYGPGNPVRVDLRALEDLLLLGGEIFGAARDVDASPGRNERRFHIGAMGHDLKDRFFPPALDGEDRKSVV